MCFELFWLVINKIHVYLAFSSFQQQKKNEIHAFELFWLAKNEIRPFASDYPLKSDFLNFQGWYIDTFRKIYLYIFICT